MLIFLASIRTRCIQVTAGLERSAREMNVVCWSGLKHGRVITCRLIHLVACHAFFFEDFKTPLSHLRF